MKERFNHQSRNRLIFRIRKFLFILVCILSYVPSIFSEEVDLNRAKRVAINYFTEKTDRIISMEDISDVIVESKEELPLIYIFNFYEGGFILVAADDVSLPILGYSDKGIFQTTNYTPAIRNQLGIYKEQIYQAKKNKVQPLPETKLQWQHYNKKIKGFIGQKSKSVSPLLSSTWSQGLYYNELCPLDPTDTVSGRVPIGCGAVAMAQVLNYWSHPWYGEGSHGYTHDDYGYLSADFNTLYNYDSMPNSLSSHNPQVAELIYHCAISIDMDFGPDGSGSWSWTLPGLNDVPDALKDYFYFSSSTSAEVRSSHLFDWHDLIKNDLDMGRPIIYGGNDLWDPAYGHIWVVDGYDGDLYHMNWGWGGNYDGYYTINNLSPDTTTTNNFNDYQRAVFWAEPKAGTLSGTITLAESPYIINYNQSIQYGDMLTIEPGVEMQFRGRYGLWVAGTLNALGTVTDTITFTTNNPIHGWGGLTFHGATIPDSSRLQYCKFTNGIAHHKSTETTTISYFQDLNQGGVVLCKYAGDVSFLNCLFTNNQSFWEGGAIRAIESSDFTIDNSVISHNFSGLSGGGISLVNSSLTINNSKIFLNENDTSGGGIHIDNSDLKLYNDTIFLNNSNYGGGIACINSNTSDVWIFNSKISDNQATSQGGGIYCVETDILFSNNRISDNTTGGKGAGLFCEDSYIVMSHNEILNNEGDEGGGGYFLSGEPLIEHSLFLGNTASAGGGMLLEACNGNLNTTTIVYNTAEWGGGIAYLGCTNPTLKKSTISKNTATSLGGGIYCLFSTPVLNSVIVWDNFGPQDIYLGSSSDVTATYCDIEQPGEDIWPGIGNIQENPLFVYPTIGDFSLRWDNYPAPDVKSPCVDAGNPASTNDPDGTRADMGAIPYDQSYTEILGGDISGTLTCAESPYFVFGDITIPAGDELIIEPCVYMIFHGDYYLQVEGRLLAEGIVSDKITFYPAYRETRWQGVRFISTNTNGQDSSKMVHCQIFEGNADGYGAMKYGGGIYANLSSKLLIDQCLFRSNQAETSGGAIYLTRSSPDIRNSIFYNNTALNGGAICCYDNVNTSFLNCYFSTNEAENGGAVLASSCGPEFSGSTITDNHALKFGGGLYRNGGQAITFDETNRCNIYNNYADYAGLDLFSEQDVYVPPVTDVYLDTATVPEINEHFAFPFHLFNTSSNFALYSQENSDLYVSPTGSDLNTGISAAQPLKTIKTALIKIMADKNEPKTIHLAEGTYSPSLTGEMLPINHRSHVTLSGESTLNTFLEGDSLHRIMVSYADINDSVKNLTLRYGYKDGDGGAVMIENNSSPVFNNVKFERNLCTGNGGAVYCFDECNPEFSNVYFLMDTSLNAGGAMFCQSIETLFLDHVDFVYNGSRYSGGALQVDATDECIMHKCHFFVNYLSNGSGGGACIRNTTMIADSVTFHGNDIIGDGGGLWAYGADINIYNSKFIANLASGSGGGIGFYLGVNLNIENTLFIGNSSNLGGGIWGYYGSTTDIKNSLFLGNNTFYNPYSTGNGGAMNLQGVSTHLSNITMDGNEAAGNGGGICFWALNPSEVHSVQNSILWNNSPDQIFLDYNATVDVDYCDIEDGWSGTGNINQNPEFVSSGDRSLQSDSPCINAGNPDTTGLSLPLFDMAGNPRISLDTLDMGAYEFFQGIELDLQAFLEGPFNGSTMNTALTGHPEHVEGFPLTQPYHSSPWNYSGAEEVTTLPFDNIVDWVLIEVRDTTDIALASSESVVGRQAVFLLDDGSLVDIHGNNIKFGNPIEHQCYISLLHRNHLGIISSTPLVESGGMYNYDFTTSIDQAYNAGQKELGSGIFGMIGGDSNADGTINGQDKINWSNQVGLGGYHLEDLNMDGQVSNQDKNEIWIKNPDSSSQIPQ